MVFALQGFTKEFIVLQKDGIGVEYTGDAIFAICAFTLLILGKKDLLEYEIQDWKLLINNSGEMSFAEVKIVFRRYYQTKLPL